MQLFVLYIVKNKKMINKENLSIHGILLFVLAEQPVHLATEKKYKWVA